KVQRALYNGTTTGGKPASLHQVKSFSQFSYNLRDLKEVIAVISIPDDDESAARRCNSSHERTAIAWFLDHHDACMLTLCDSGGRIGAAIVRDYNFTGDVIFPESSQRFLDAISQSVGLIEAGNDHGHFNSLNLAFELHVFLPHVQITALTDQNHSPIAAARDYSAIANATRWQASLMMDIASLTCISTNLSIVSFLSEFSAQPRKPRRPAGASCGKGLCGPFPLWLAKRL